MSWFPWALVLAALTVSGCATTAESTWSFQRQVVRDFDIFFHGFYNAASLPRLINFQSSSSNNSIPSINVVGVGAIWTVNDRLAVFGSYNFGTTTGSPHTIALTGFAVAF